MVEGPADELTVTVETTVVVVGCPCFGEFGQPLVDEPALVGTVRHVGVAVSQAYRWGWRDSNPAEWAGPPRLAPKISVSVVP